jgi:hypothetical protein
MRQVNCKHCDIEMKPSKGILNTWVSGMPDFPGDKPFSEGQTLSVGGPGELIDVLKCPECGYSVQTKKDETGTLQT